MSPKRKSKGVSSTLVSKPDRSETEKITSTLETIGLAEKADVRAGALSHGEKQWLEIGMVLLQDPALLLIDEPVAGMIVRETEQTGLLFQSTADRSSIYAIEHSMVFG